ncbi:MAG: EamA family transporter [Alphaproteobacteria bacterium]|nr:EamA family transporter [Alphaproteobacteria bacterium]
MEGAWIAFTLAAAGLQAVRTAAQRAVAQRLSPDAGNFARFVFGLPVAIAYLLALAASGRALPLPGIEAIAIVGLGALCQVLATRALILAVTSANFGTGVAFSKTDVVQAAAFEALVLQSYLGPLAVLGVVCATLGVMMMSVRKGERLLGALLTGWTQEAALWGLAAGAGYAVSGVCYRAAALALGGGPLEAAATALALALMLQTFGLSLWLSLREPGSVMRVLRDVRVSGVAGIAGGLGSLCWFSALALQPVAYVRTLGLIELVFSLAISLFVFRERPGAFEYAGLCVLAAGIAVLLLSG